MAYSPDPGPLDPLQTQGKCQFCGIRWVWQKWRGRLHYYDLDCPLCGGPLSQTTYLVKLPVYDRDLAMQVIVEGGLSPCTYHRWKYWEQETDLVCKAEAYYRLNEIWFKDDRFRLNLCRYHQEAATNQDGMQAPMHLILDEPEFFVMRTAALFRKRQQNFTFQYQQQRSGIKQKPKKRA